MANIVKAFGEQKSEKAKFFCEQTVLTNRKKLSYSVGYLGLIGQGRKAKEDFHFFGIDYWPDLLYNDSDRLNPHLLI